MGGGIKKSESAPNDMLDMMLSVCTFIFNPLDVIYSQLNSNNMHICMNKSCINCQVMDVHNERTSWCTECIIKEWSRAAANYAISYYISFQNQLRWCITIIFFVFEYVSIVMKCDIFFSFYSDSSVVCNWFKLNGMRWSKKKLKCSSEKVKEMN